MPKGIPNKQKQVKEEAKAKVDKELRTIDPEIRALERIVLNTCGDCSHEEATHYGGVKGHCNTSNCPCLEFK